MSTVKPSRYRSPEQTWNNSYLRNLRMAIKGDPTPNESQIESLVSGLYEGDPLADTWILDAQKLGPGRGNKMLDEAIEKGIDQVDNAPDSLRQLFAQIDRQPDWLDPHLLDVGARAFQRNMLPSMLLLTHVSLMGGYSAASVIKPLVITGRLSSKAVGRLGETTRFVVDVSKPGAMQRDGAGFRASVKVRIMHAMVRQMLNQSDSWQKDDWGAPINQTDMVGTNLLFSTVYLMGCRMLGYRFSQEESLGIMHLWRYIGYLMGVGTERLPSSEIEGKRQLYRVSCIQDEPDADSRSLAQALHRIPADRAEGRLAKMTAPIRMRAYAGFTRLFTGRAISDELGLPKTRGLQYFIPLAYPFVSALEFVRILVPGMTSLKNRLGQIQYEYYVGHYLKMRSTSFKANESLKQHASR